MKVVYMSHRNNWGDAISPHLARRFSGEEVQKVTGDDQTPGVRYAITGSILGWLKNPETVCWGPGLISPERHVNPHISILAVRGPLTREAVLAQGKHCPDVYGDPALLYPLIYNPQVTKKYEVGIIPHYVDQKEEWVEKHRKSNNVTVIDITGTAQEVQDHRFVNQVLECSKIVSSSLHGIILAQAYGIPAKWIKLTDKVIGEGFKFRDYLKSVGNDTEAPFLVNGGTSLVDVIKDMKEVNLKIDLRRLLEVCPFKK